MSIESQNSSKRTRSESPDSAEQVHPTAKRMRPLTSLLAAGVATDDVIEAVRKYMPTSPWKDVAFCVGLCRKVRGSDDRKWQTMTWIGDDHPFAENLRAWCAIAAENSVALPPLPEFVATYGPADVRYASAPIDTTSADLFDTAVAAMRGVRRRGLLQSVHAEFVRGVSSGTVAPVLQGPLPLEAVAYAQRTACPADWLTWRQILVAFGAPDEVQSDALLVKRIAAALWSAAPHPDRAPRPLGHTSRWWCVKGTPSIYNVVIAGREIRQALLIVATLAAGGMTVEERMSLGRRLM